MKKTKDLLFGVLIAILIGGVCVFVLEKTKNVVTRGNQTTKKYTVERINKIYNTIISEHEGYNRVNHHTTCFVYLKSVDGVSDTLLLLQPAHSYLLTEGQQVILFIDK